MKLLAAGVLLACVFPAAASADPMFSVSASTPSGVLDGAPGQGRPPADAHRGRDSRDGHRVRARRAARQRRHAGAPVRPAVSDRHVRGALDPHPPGLRRQDLPLGGDAHDPAVHHGVRGHAGVLRARTAGHGHARRGVHDHTGVRHRDRGGFARARLHRAARRQPADRDDPRLAPGLRRARLRRSRELRPRLALRLRAGTQEGHVAGTTTVAKRNSWSFEIMRLPRAGRWEFYARYEATAQGVRRLRVGVRRRSSGFASS